MKSQLNLRRDYYTGCARRQLRLSVAIRISGWWKSRGWPSDGDAARASQVLPCNPCEAPRNEPHRPVLGKYGHWALLSNRLWRCSRYEPWSPPQRKWHLVRRALLPLGQPTSNRIYFPAVQGSLQTDVSGPLFFWRFFFPVVATRLRHVMLVQGASWLRRPPAAGANLH